MSTPRIAVGSLLTECNHLGGKPITFESFAGNEMRRDGEVLCISTSTVGGMLDALRSSGAEPVPLLVTSSVCGGPITADAHRRLKAMLLDDLRKRMPVDGVLLALHGSATAEGTPDVEGDLLGAVRAIVGERVPVVATLDLHAHVTREMVHHADALVAWETYPHKDSYTTGQRGATLLLRIVRGEVRPAMALAKVPVLVSGVNGHTEGPGPFADVMRFAKAFEPSSQSPPPTLPGARQVDRSKVLSTNLFLVHPYLDLPDMGGGAVVVTDGDAQLAADIARTIAMRYWDCRFDLDPPTMTPEQAIIAGRAMTERPVLLVETSDCAGGGAAGDSVATLRALLACGADHDAAMSALVPVVDPEAAAACHAAGAGATLTLDLGHKLDPKWGKPLRVTGRVDAVSDGRFRYTGGIWEGLEKSMGRSAVLAIGSTRVLVMSQPTYDWADEQFRSMNLRAEEAKFVVVKNPMNFRFAYAGMAQKWIVLDTPGPTPPHLHHVRFERMKRPYYPADSDIPGLTPTLVVRPSRF